MKCLGWHAKSRLFKPGNKVKIIKEFKATNKNICENRTKLCSVVIKINASEYIEYTV